jgi:hypothetical protein
LSDISGFIPEQQVKGNLTEGAQMWNTVLRESLLPNLYYESAQNRALGSIILIDTSAGILTSYKALENPLVYVFTNQMFFRTKCEISSDSQT